MDNQAGNFTLTYRSPRVHGLGVSASSNWAVLYMAIHNYLQSGPPIDLEKVANLALDYERGLAKGHAVAANDVYTIVNGGVVMVETLVKGNNDKVNVRDIPCDPHWLAEHTVFGYNPRGKRHDIPNLLSGLFQQKNAKNHVKNFSSLAKQAEQALVNRQIQELGKAVNAYRNEFNEWTRAAEKKVSGTVNSYPPYTRAVAGISAALENKLGGLILGWKPPGGGASESLLVVCQNIHARDEVVKFLRSRLWWANPVCVTSGVCPELYNPGGDVRITAGHRLDFVGAADLGQDPMIGENGCCCSVAIEPRSEISIFGANPEIF